MASFIEVQFPVSKLSKESYKERKGAQGQTLTQLGKWWGGKPLVLVRAALLGLLIPASDNPKRDREIFLKLMGMDDAGLWYRKIKSIPKDVLYSHLNPSERSEWFDELPDIKPELKRLSREDREKLQRLVFFRLNYDDRIGYCALLAPAQKVLLEPIDLPVIGHSYIYYVSYLFTPADRAHRACRGVPEKANAASIIPSDMVGWACIVSLMSFIFKRAFMASAASAANSVTSWPTIWTPSTSSVLESPMILTYPSFSPEA